MNEEQEEITKPDFDLEAVYDEKIAPLMSQIISICREHKMPLFATFQYAHQDDEASFCTTNDLFVNDRPVAENMKKLWSTLNRKEPIFAFTITSPDKA